MKFQRYASIENHYQKKYIEKILIEQPKDIKWVVTEKIHGANLSIHYDGKHIRVAKRSCFINLDENFFNWQAAVDLEKIKTMYAKLTEHQLIRYGQKLSLYGELCGGKYNHTDVAKSLNPSTKAIQKEVQYHPDNKFLIFDIAVDDVYIDYETMHLFEHSNRYLVDFIPVLGVFDTLQGALELNAEFQTLIEDNMSEGLVIKPSRDFFLYDNDRVIIKKKSKAFSEKSTVKEPKVSIVYSDRINHIISIAESYVTLNRLNNVLSKEGWTIEDLESKVLGKSIGLFTTDSIVDFIKDNQEAYNSLIKEEQKIITKHLAGFAAKFLKSTKFGYV
jgi:Rnl2 family RNA ligase